MIDRVMSALFRATNNMKITPSKPLDKIQSRPLELKHKLTAEVTREISASPRPKDNLPPDTSVQERNDQLPYVPLPLRSEFYQDARFYARLQDFKYKTGNLDETRIIFCLRTVNLGQLWFNLAIRPGKLLSVQCLTENNSSAELFKENAELLQAALVELGFASVIVSCRPQPGIQSIADIDPEFAMAKPFSLLDRQV
ncbi:hypothetical protein Desca_0251 [Desulfotomaculum nigrificans CO-1-SRB]|uniref:Flagellar hook-length control protein-like C-terminal domain-containing protein n=1 Tax=Desulfotomaculum nigrificans (strain DSM 14880 / VKM B-2319 / CO-1-SRB) TaxID=868595 RepID=F6B5T2_DESCC|nr:flagellar hook-length control protein FliK [Desulfotomaculum nigrificans]AEF93155.1 hypothetical protein Desca_0251 [Desulfotomaculum nigrificans CO-1-SRB]